MVRYPVAGVILAGGLNRRMNGQNKALLTVEGQTLVGRLIERFTELFEQVILVSNRPVELSAWECLIASDLLPARGSLVGLHAGLFFCRPSHAFVVACDMPFLKPEMIALILEHWEPRWEVVVPVTAEGYQPLCAVYAKGCIKLIENQVRQGRMKISRWYDQVKVKTIPESSLRQVDPELISFFNINTHEDWQRFQSLKELLTDGRTTVPV